MREVKTESIADNLEEYVKAAAGGDQEAFEALYHYSYRIVAAECYEVLHSALDVEDAVQDTHLRIFRNLDKLKDPNKFLGWCRTIAHNQSITIVTREKNKNGKDDLRPPVSDETAIGMDALDSEDLDSSPTDELEQELIKKYLQSAIDTLSADRMMCLAMHQQGYTYQQISDETAIPLGTVKSSMHYAKKQLAKAVERIEKESGIKLHAFTLVPVAGHVVPKLESEEGGWISARSEAGAAGREHLECHSQEAAWRFCLRSCRHSRYNGPKNPRCHPGIHRCRGRCHCRRLSERQERQRFHAQFHAGHSGAR